jgi:hypothetical protein
MKKELEILVIEEENKRRKSEAEIEKFHNDEITFIKSKYNSSSNCQLPTTSNSYSSFSLGSGIKITPYKDISLLEKKNI